MAKTRRKLQAESPLGGFETRHNDTHLSEIQQLSLVSLAPFTGAMDRFHRASKTLFDKQLPDPRIALIGENRFLMPSAHNQWFLGFTEKDDDAVSAAKALLGAATTKVVAMTDQSDAWAALSLSGGSARIVLEHLCQLDCRDTAMPQGATARTIMAHLGVILLRQRDTDEGTPCFWMFTPRSSAQSFLDSVMAVPPFTR